MSNMCSFSLSSEARNDAEIVGPQDVLEMGATIAPGSRSAGRTRSRRPKNFFEGLVAKSVVEPSRKRGPYAEGGISGK